MASPTWRVTVQRSGSIIGSSVAEAVGSWQSFRGLMFMRQLPPGHGLLFRPARGIHTHFMRFPIDLVYLDEANHVAKIRSFMAPWRFDFTRAPAVIELAAGAAQEADTRVGDRLVFEAIVD